MYLWHVVCEKKMMSGEKAVLVILVVSLFSATSYCTTTFEEEEPSEEVASLSCPPGFVLHENHCVCGNWPGGMVLCDQDSQQASMQIGYCMTYYDEKIRAGVCAQGFFQKDSYKFYYPLPTNMSELNDYICGPFNSEGILCGQCKDGYAVPPFTYPGYYNCVNYRDAGYWWAKYLAVEFIPTTAVFGYHDLQHQHSISSSKCIYFLQPDIRKI